MNKVRHSTVIDEDADYEIRDLRKRCGKIRPEETTSRKKTTIFQFSCHILIG